MGAGERQEEQPAGLRACKQLVSQAWGCTVPLGTFLPALLVTRGLGDLPASSPSHLVLMAQSPASAGSIQPSAAH